MRIATWNVNSVKQRLENLSAWLPSAQPDIVCLQETKSVDEAFPREPIEALGYNVAVHGQKTFNGVAILSKMPFDEVTPRPARRHGRRSCPLPRRRGLDEDRRAAGGVHLPAQRQPGRTPTNIPTNSNGWSGFLTTHMNDLKLEEPLILAGDYNVIPAAARRPQSGRLGQRRAVPAADAGQASGRCSISA